jgi:hypothetical protein
MRSIRAIWAFPWRNRTFTAALLLAAAVRVVTMLAFRPAIWFGGDSAGYLAVALRLRPDAGRVSGYGLMLAALRPFHSFMLVTAVQHAMGLAIGVAIYLLLRARFGLPAWAATLAAAPVLFDAYQIELEHEVLSDVAFEFLVVAALLVALWWHGKPEPKLKPTGPAWATVVAGALLAVAGIVRPIGLPLLALYLCYLLVRRVGWRVLGATLAAAALPLAMYVAWFGAAFHVLNFTTSDGIFLWSRTMSFANCQAIKPSADEALLCPRDGRRLAASSYVWVPSSPLNKIPIGRFSAAKNELALRFALRAIAAQPAGYAGAVLHDFMLSFYWNRPVHPSTAIVDRYQFSMAERAWVPAGLPTPGGGTVTADQRAYAGSAATTSAAAATATTTATTAHEPYAGFMRGYQRYVYLRGTMLGIILLLGCAALAAPAAAPALLPWLTAIAMLAVPVAAVDFDLRYVVPAVPVACLAGALAFASPRRGTATQPVFCSPAATPLTVSSSSRSSTS